MANWSNPLLTSTYTNFVTEVKDRDADLALQFDGTTSTNIPTNTIRWNSSVNRWQKWNGSTWGELTSTYALTGLTTTGNATIGGTLGSGAFTSTGSVSGTALLPTGNTVPTNGVYLPSANVLGIATSSTARIVIGASGDVGIGTLSPAVGLHLAQAAASATSGNFYVAPGSAGQARMRLYNQGGLAEWIYGQKTGTDHDFKLSKSVAGSEADYLTVTTMGSVGIQTNSPGSLLDVNGAITARGDGAQVALYMPGNIAIRNTGTATTTYIDLATGSASHGEFILRSSNTYAERLRINSAGNVGIGTSGPGSLLDLRFATSPINDNGVGSNALRVWTSSALAADTGGAISLGGVSQTGGGSSAFGQIAGRKVNATSANYAGYLQFSVNSSGGTMFEAMRIDSSGNVGIGQPSPVARLHVQAPSASRQYTSSVLDFSNIHIDGITAGSATSALTFSSGGSGGAAVAFNRGTSFDTAISFWTNSAASANVATERLRIDSSGRVGIGTSAPIQKLSVHGIASDTIDETTGVCKFQDNGGNGLLFGTRASAPYQSYIQSAFVQDTSVAQYSLLLNPLGGNVGLGTTSPGTPFDVALPSVSATTGNVRISPSFAGQARYHLYNGGATAEWLFGQKTSTDHDFKLSTSVAGSETDRLTVTTGGLLKFDSGYGSAATAYGCRAWVNFNGTGTVAIRASANVSSITDNGIGQYQVNFTATMPDANYAAVSDCRDADASRVGNYATGSAEVLTYNVGSFVDSNGVSVVVFR